MPERQSNSLRFWATLLPAVIGFRMAAYLVSLREKPDLEKPMIQESNNGLVTIESRHSVDETVQKLKQILDSKGIKLFTVIDHSGAAEDVGMNMPPTKLLIFGNPKAGTPLMIGAPTIAIDLPLKLLVRQDSDGAVRISYNDPEYLQNRHGLPAELVKNIAVVGALAAEAAK
jgi:uncharacterized protein (DUF302 family)